MIPLLPTLCWSISIKKYSVLGNSLFMRLVWQAFMFLQDPFFSIADNTKYFSHFDDYLPTVLKLHREKTGPRCVLPSISPWSRCLWPLTSFMRTGSHSLRRKRKLLLFGVPTKKPAVVLFSRHGATHLHQPGGISCWKLASSTGGACATKKCFSKHGPQGVRASQQRWSGKVRKICGHTGTAV